MAGNTTFIRITNQHIYEKLLDIDKHVRETNGKVKLNKWISSTSLLGVFGLAGWMFYILLRMS